MSKKNPWLMDEPVELVPAGPVLALQGVMIAFMVLCAVWTADAATRVICIIVAIVVGGLMALMHWLMKRYRVIMDETGVRLGSKHTLEWTQVRTAAVIQRGDPRWPNYNSRRSDWHFILLSVQEPQKTLDKWNVRLEAAKPGRDIRIPYTYRRRQIVEHYLHMELPTFRL